MLLSVLERSAVFMFLNKTCFRGLCRMSANGFNVPFGNYKNPTILLTKDNLNTLSFFLKDVTFKVSDFEKSFRSVKKGDFIYLDPPYVPKNSNSFVNYTKEGFSLKKYLTLY